MIHSLFLVCLLFVQALTPADSQRGYEGKYAPSQIQSVVEKHEVFNTTHCRIVYPTYGSHRGSISPTVIKQIGNDIDEIPTNQLNQHKVQSLLRLYGVGFGPDGVVAKIIVEKKENGQAAILLLQGPMNEANARRLLSITK